MPNRRLLALLEVTLAVILWGASFVATKLALRDVQPITLVWLRFAMGVIILGLTVLARRELVVPSWREFLYLALLGFLGITLHQWLQSNALETSQATTSAWIVATTPVFIALLSWLVLKELLGWSRVAGVALAGTGVLLVVTKGNLNLMALGRIGAPGDLLVMISAVNWAVFTVLSRRGLRLFSPALMMFYVILIGWLFSSLLFFPTAGVIDIGHLTVIGWIGVIFLGIFCSGFAYIFWYDALKLVPASQVGVFLYFEPLVTVIVAAVVLGETFPPAAAMGGAIIILGVWLVTRRTDPKTDTETRPRGPHVVGVDLPSPLDGDR